MSASLKQLTGEIVPVPDIKCSLALEAMSEIKKHASEPHGASLIAITMLDTRNKTLNVDMKFDTEMELNTFFSNVLAVWGKYEPIPAYLRSYKQDGKYMESLDSAPLEVDVKHPASLEDYAGKKAVVDMILTGRTDVILNVYRWGEQAPRALTLSLKPLKSSIQ